MKKNEKQNEHFLEFLKISWFGVRICNFESKFSFFFICNFIFFHFPLFLMVFHCFSLFFMVFLDFRCHGKGKWKKRSLKWKKWSLKWKKWCLKWKKMKFGETKNEKNEKNWKKWKINENKKMIEKQNEKMKLQMKTQMKNKWKK